MAILEIQITNPTPETTARATEIWQQLQAEKTSSDKFKDMLSILKAEKKVPKHDAHVECFHDAMAEQYSDMAEIYQHHLGGCYTSEEFQEAESKCHPALFNK